MTHATETQLDGRLVIREDVSVIHALAAEALRHGLSLSSEVRQRLRAGLELRDDEDDGPKVA